MIARFTLLSKCLMISSVIMLCSFDFLNAQDNVARGNMENDTSGYAQNIQKVIGKIIEKEDISIEELQKTIPKTEDEFLIFYSFTEKDEAANKAFYALDKLLFENAMKAEPHIFDLYLELSQFVDGEYAESYFEDVEAVIKKNKTKFCEQYSKLPNGKVSRLQEYYEKYCGNK